MYQGKKENGGEGKRGGGAKLRRWDIIAKMMRTGQKGPSMQATKAKIGNEGGVWGALTYVEGRGGGRNKGKKTEISVGRKISRPWRS